MSDSDRLNVLYLVNKNTFLVKMSRVRFHAMNAIGKITNLTYWGLGWDNYDEKLTVQQNLDLTYPTVHFDVVVVYKPLELKEFGQIKYTKCITYNEMYDFNATLKEIENGNIDLVICHHENDMKTYQSYYSNYHGQKNKKVKFVHIPHSAEASIFMDKQTEKKYDVLLCGRLSCINTLNEQHYPLRDRMANVLKKMPKKYKWGIHKHPKSNNADSFTDKYLIEFADAINSSKLCVTCSGLPKSRFGKYVEIPMCNSVIVADIPDQDQDEFRKFVIEIDMKMTDEEIINKICYYLEHEEELNKMREYGYNWSKQYTQELYAKRFITTVKEFKNLN